MTQPQGRSGIGRDHVAVVTNVNEYAGPGAARALADAGFTVACHDRSFTEPPARETFATSQPGLQPFPDQDPQELVDSVLARLGRIDVVVSNDFVPGDLWQEPTEPPDPGSAFVRRIPLEDADAGAFRATLEDLVIRPFTLCRAVLPAMKARRSGAILLITSAVSYRAAPEYEMYSAGRSAATCMAQGLAIEVAPYNIQVNPIGPAWFDSPTYFPARHRERFMPVLEREVPLGRLGRQDELGALIVFLASGQAAPICGQFIPFTAGTRLRR